MQLDATGRIVVGGLATSESSRRAAVVRLTAEGSFDAGFGTHGVVISETLWAGIEAIALDSAGHIRAAGHLGNPWAGPDPVGHMLFTARYAPSRAQTTYGQTNIESTTAVSHVAHARLDLAVATLASPIEVAGYEWLQYAEPGDAPMSCFGVGATQTLSQGEFKVETRGAETVTVKGQPRPDQPDFALTQGDSGGGCFSASGALVGITIRSAESFTDSSKKRGVLIPGDLVAAALHPAH